MRENQIHSGSKGQLLEAKASRIDDDRYLEHSTEGAPKLVFRRFSYISLAY